MQILTFKESLAVWRSISFLGHFMMLSLILVSLVLPPKTPARSLDAIKEEQQQQPEVKATSKSNRADSMIAGQ